ncbi:FIST N-terminal domain-containing protein [Chthonobacter rhizosphaerae]|uniref:FIST N-terminal domain-containing protein n=1 Tax=Chthonobacter rhizosphaerae TaxID=2735553 RepID=UPI0015EF85AF|nr:FIST N-terminal domain-containing protein [Chthonobacter rhizosphaerae]
MGVPSPTEGRDFSSGIKTLSVADAPLDAAVAAVGERLDTASTGFLMVFFSASYDAVELGAAFRRILPGVPVVGCSTAGEISAEGLSDGGLVAIAFPRAGFDIVSGVIPDLSRLGIDRGSEAVTSLKADLMRRRPDMQPGRTFAVSLIDGLCMREEAVVSAIDWALGEIPLVGGSAGDGLSFRATSLLHDGRIHTDAAILILVHTDHPFKVFKTDNFRPTGQRLVVTASDPETRTVFELNAEVAADEYATHVGMEADRLSPFGFASHPMVVRVGGEYFCRSLRCTNPDGSLSFFCAIDDGVVLTMAEPVDLVSSVEAALQKLDRDLGGIDWILGFDCVLRRLDAQNRQVAHRISELYKQHKVFGFNTYGEQFRTMHLNQTFTGVAIGRGGTVR